MKYQTFLSPKAKRDFDKFPGPVKVRIDRAILLLQDNPYQFGIKKIKSNTLAEFRVRVGDYRILYDIYPKDNVIYILRVGHRKEIYR